MRYTTLLFLISFFFLISGCAGIQLPSMPWSDDSTKAEEPAVEEAPTEEITAAPTEEQLPEEYEETAPQPEEKSEAESESGLGQQIESIEETTPQTSETQSIVEPAAEESDRFACPPSDDKSAKERRIEGIEALANGKEYKAKRALNLALCSNPDDKISQDILEQINSDLYPPEPFFEYTVAEGDTLSKIADRFLDDRFKFYALAKFNGIENPSMVKPGRVIKVPGEQPPEAAAAPEPETIEPGALEESLQESPPSEETEISEISPPKQTTPPGPSTLETAKKHADSQEFEQVISLLEPELENGVLDEAGKDLLVDAYLKQAEKLADQGFISDSMKLSKKAQALRPDDSGIKKTIADSEKTLKIKNMYDNAIQALESGKTTQANTFLGQILELEPDNAQAREKLNEVQGRLIETYSRDAMFAYRRQELTKAVRLWDQVLELDPANEMAKLRKAEAVDLMDRLQKLGEEGR